MTNKKITFKQKELVSFITETITDMYVNRLINEQEEKVSVTYLGSDDEKWDGPVHTYKGSKQDSLNAWAKMPTDIKNALQSLSVPIGPFSVISHSYYMKLPRGLQTFLYGYLYPVKIDNEFIANSATVAGEATYMFIPATTKYYNIPTVHICADKQTGKRIDCTSLMALDGTHQASGFEVSTSQVQVPSLFGYDEAKMNTKYFCKKYILGDEKTPENVKPKVLMHLQHAYSNKTGDNLGINSSKGPEYYYGGSNLSEKLADLKDYDILYLVSEYIDAKIDQQKERYMAGEWRYMMGSKLNPEAQMPLTDAQHKRYFKEMKNFAAMLLKTNCGYGVGKSTLTAAERQIREKYGDIFAFEKERPEGWDEMSSTEQATWEKNNKSDDQKQTTLERQNDTQFWWDMISVAIIIVAVVLTVVSAGTLAPVAAGLVYLSVGMGVASSIFDMWQGEWGWGVTGLVLEAIPFIKIIKMSKFLKVVKITDKKFNKMVEYGLKHGKEALIPKYGKSGKALYKALSENANEVAKMLDANTKESLTFLKRFSTMDPSEFYLLQQLNKGFKTSMKGIPYSQFDAGVVKLSDILFANRTAFRTLIGKARFALSLPMKMIGLNLAGLTLYNSHRCFDYAVDITGEKLLTMVTLAPLFPPGAAIVGLNMLEMTLDTSRIEGETLCTLFALISQNISPKEIESLEKKLEDELDNGNVTIVKEGDNIKITIDNITGEDGTTETVTVTDLEDISETVTDLIDDTATLMMRAYIEKYTGDEEILEYWILELGGEQRGVDKLDDLMKRYNNFDREATDIMWDLMNDTDKIFKNKKHEIEARYQSKLKEYGVL